MSVAKEDHDRPKPCRCTQPKPEAALKDKKPDQPDESILIRLIPSPGNDLRALRTSLPRNEASRKSPTTGPSYRTTTLQSSTGLHVSNAGPLSQPLQWIPSFPYPGAQGQQFQQQLLQVPFGPPLQGLQTVPFPQHPVYSTLMAPAQSFPPPTSVTAVASAVASNEGNKHCCQSSHGQHGFTIPPYALSFLGDLYKSTAGGGSRPASPQGNNIRIKTTFPNLRSKHKHRKHKHGKCSLDTSSSSELRENKPRGAEVANHIGYSPAVVCEPWVDGPEDLAQENPTPESQAKPTDENPEGELQEKNNVTCFTCAVVIVVIGLCALALLVIIFFPSSLDWMVGRSDHSAAWQKRNFRDTITFILRKLVQEHHRATETAGTTASVDNDTSVTM